MRNWIKRKLNIKHAACIANEKQLKQEIMRIINESDARIAELERDNARLSTALSGEHPFATTIALATCKEIATKLVEAVEARHRIGYGLTFNRYSDQKKMQEHSAACEREKEAIERWHKEMGR